MGMEDQLLGSRVSALIIRATALLAEANDEELTATLNGVLLGVRNLRDCLVHGPSLRVSQPELAAADAYVTRQTAIVDSVEASLRSMDGRR